MIRVCDIIHVTQTIGATGTAAATATPATPTATPAPTFPLSLVDDGGTTVAIPAEPQRIVSLTPAATETLFALGIGGAWIGDLTALEPYQPIFVAVTAGLLAAGYYLVHRQRRAACADDAACGRPLPAKFVTIMLWAAAALVAAAAAFPYVATPLLGT